ncbi:MAG: S8 family serine peptidase [Defluviitaleaceae bacterium]|nr:S8 family serine peptidase [Defluviitaleaceae bacterium]
MDIEVIIKHSGNLVEIDGVTVEDMGDGFAIFTLPSDRIDELYNLAEIEYIEFPKNLVLQMRQGMDASCITQVESRFDVNGQGVAIGIIDSGIDATHPAFYNRILAVYDVSTREEFSEQAAMFNSDAIGHGTAVSGIAAGVAPGSSLIVAKLPRGAQTTHLMRGLNYLSNKALSLGMPLVINLSYGTNHGSHAGNTLFETYIDAVARRWKTVIVVASGNEGFAGHHFGGMIASGQTLLIDFAVGGGLQSVYLTLWKNFVDDFSLELIAPGGQSTGILDPRRAVSQFTLFGTQVTVFYGRPSFYSGQQEIYIDLRGHDRFVSQGIWRLRAVGQNIVDGEFHIWLPTLEEVGTDTSFLRPDPNISITLPATSQSVISVGGYNSMLNTAADFSGRGFTYSIIFPKPDLVAPAVNIRSTRPGGYDSFSGTSMAAPFVAGASAVMMHWGIVRGNDPFLYGQRVKGFLRRGAIRQPGVTYPNPIWGYGKLCLENTMELLNM